MSILQAIVLGLVQGATEFAPVSSSGHLILVPWMFGWGAIGDPDLQKSFDVALHMGTLLGALIYFRSDVARYAAAWLHSIVTRRMSTPDERIAWALVVGTIPGAIIGALFEDVIQEKLGAPWLIAVMLVAFGIVLVVVDRRARSDRDFDSIGPKEGLLLGTAQALALQPGVSRSGVTITAARAMGLDRESAARFSFLLSLPIIAGAGAYKAVDLAQTGLQGYAAEFVAGMVASAISGFVVIWGLLRYLKRHDFTVFLGYRVALAAVVAILIVANVRDATL
ncbi:MAG TPA: undecaprenyl-diphosphatase UppP [Actinomycetota bacterium]|nr:undecaprenyl-diphosphatase UppP [Actinomycetota bacterium]